MKKILSLSNRKKVDTMPAEPEHNYYKGPKTSDMPTPWFIRPSDWYAKNGSRLLTIRPNNDGYFFCDTKDKYLSLENIEDFTRYYGAYREMTVVVYTRTANSSMMFPPGIDLVLKNSTITIKEGNCSPKDVDWETRKVVQAILDTWKEGINFEAIYQEWKERNERVFSDGEPHLASEVCLRAKISL